MLIRTLEQRHPRYDAPRLTRWEALYEGGAAWEAIKSEMLPKRPAEQEEVYTFRMAQATYVNHVGPICDVIAGWLFADAPTVDGIPAGWTDDVDRTGTGMADWWRQRLVRALVGRRAYAWVNLPEVALPEGATLADQDAAGGRDAYMVGLDADEVINWTYAPDGALSAIMIRREATEQADLLSPQRRVIRWILVDAVAIRRWEWRPTENGPTVPKPEESATELPAVAHGFGRIPVVVIDLSPGLHALGKLDHAATRLTRDEDALGWGLGCNMHPLLHLATDDPKAPPVLGAGFFFATGAADKLAMIESSGAGFDAMAARVQSDMEGLYRIVQQMAQSANAESSKASTSGSSKAMDWQALEIMLRSYAAVVLTAIRQALEICNVAWRLPEEGIIVTGLGSWSSEDLAENLANMLLASPLVKSETFQREIAKRTVGAILDDAEAGLIDKINAEIDAANYTIVEVLPPMPKSDVKPDQNDDATEA